MRNCTESESDLLDDIFELDDENLGSILPVIDTPVLGYLEITLNHPRTAKFRRLTDEIKREVYKNLYLKIKQLLSKHIEHDEFYFENCKDGIPHLHASITVSFDTSGSAMGLVSEIVRTYLNALPGKHKVYKSENEYPYYSRYKGPAICCQWTQIDDFKRIAAWEQYIIKSQDIV